MSQRAQIVSAARARGLNPDLVEAVVLVESGGNPYAWNPEPHYRYLWNVATRSPFRKMTQDERLSEIPPIDFPTLAGDRDQEFWAQQASWGLMQIMGAVAREAGFVGPYLPQLVDPVLNLQVGTKLLLGHILHFNGDLEKGIAAYNGGRGGYDLPAPVRYAQKVLARLRIVEATRKGATE
jgi:hypothetical protein